MERLARPLPVNILRSRRRIFNEASFGQPNLGESTCRAASTRIFAQSRTTYVEHISTVCSAGSLALLQDTGVLNGRQSTIGWKGG